MFSQVLDKLDSWLGRSFLLARYFPWLLFAGANLLLAAAEFPDIRTLLASEYSNITSSGKIVDSALAFGAVAVVAYTLSPGMLAIQRLLEGRELWQWIAEPMVLRRVIETQALVDRRRSLFQDRAGLEERVVIVKRLAAFRAAGKNYATITDRSAIDTAEEALKSLRSRRFLNRPIRAGEIAVAVQTMATALQRNCADLIWLKQQPSPLPGDILADASRLDRLHRELCDEILPYATDIAQNRERHALAAHDKLYAKAEVAPTRLGNEVAALRSYCDSRYGFDFDFFWPRLQLVMKDDKLATKLSGLQIQVEFSMLSLSLSCLFVVSWLIVLGGWGHSLVTLLLLVMFGPLVIFMWLWLVHESYSTYAEFLRGAIDVSRFDLLQALRRQLPQTTEAEKAVWEQTARLLVLNEHDVDVELKHPSA